MSVESSGQVNLAKTYKPTFEWSQIDPGAGELTNRWRIPIRYRNQVTDEHVKRRNFILSEANNYSQSKQDHAIWSPVFENFYEFSVSPFSFVMHTLAQFSFNITMPRKIYPNNNTEADILLTTTSLPFASNFLAQFFNILREYFLIILLREIACVTCTWAFRNTRFTGFKY